MGAPSPEEQDQQRRQQRQEIMLAMDNRLQEVRHTLLHGSWDQLAQPHQSAYQAWAQQRSAAGEDVATPQQWYMAEVVMKGLGNMLLTGAPAPVPPAAEPQRRNNNQRHQDAAAVETAAAVPVGQSTQQQQQQQHAAENARGESARPRGRSTTPRRQCRRPETEMEQRWEHA